MSEGAGIKALTLRKLGRWLGFCWLLLLLALGFQQWRLWHAGSRIDTDILALLPQDADHQLVRDVTRRIADAGARQIIILIGDKNGAATRAARTAFADSIAKDAGGGWLQPAGSMDGWFDQARMFYAPYRNRLLTPGQRQYLQKASLSDLAGQALARLYGPMDGLHLTGWRQDPLALWPQWWQHQALGSGLVMGQDGLLEAAGKRWAILQYNSRDSAFKLDGDAHLAALLQHATAAAKSRAADIEIVKAGVPLYAEAAAVQANREINTIGWGSLAAVLLLVWLAFRSLRPILLVASSLLIGCGVALAVTVLVFGKIHVLTLVFGASLVGVAEDYGIHWFASRQADPGQSRWELLGHLLPGLALALGTSALAYVAVGLAPFPGLRQMALFSVVGLSAAFATVVLWFPWLDDGEIRQTRFSRWLGATLHCWPRLQRKRTLMIFCGTILAVSLPGVMHLHGDDNVRDLQAAPAALVADQIRLGQVLGMPSPAQFYLVEGDSPGQVLQREEALTARLARLVAQRQISGYRAISDWLPSPQRQQTDAALTARAEHGVLAAVSAQVGQRLDRPSYPEAMLTIQSFLASPVSLPFRSLWLGSVGHRVISVVRVDDMSHPAALVSLQQQAQGLAGVLWIDRTADFSRLLGHYRRLMTAMLLFGVVLVFALLFLRYRGQAWRVMAPTLLAGVLTLGLLGLLGQPMELFNVLALLLLLGMGIDYGIFLMEHRGDASAWLAVCVGGASTWLSFGLLGLSSTPALRAFGLTLLFGIALVWVISPLFRPEAVEAHA